MLECHLHCTSFLACNAGTYIHTHIVTVRRLKSWAIFLDDPVVFVDYVLLFMHQFWRYKNESYYLFCLLLVDVRSLSLQLKCIYTSSSYRAVNTLRFQTNLQCSMFRESHQTHNTLRAKCIVSFSFYTDAIFTYRCLSEG